MATVKARSSGSGTGPALLAIRILALLLGVFFLAQGLNKLAWLLDGSILAERLQNWMRDAPPSVRWYLETVLPGAPLFARLVPLAELGAGMALMVGFWPRLAAGLACVMVLNFHFALGSFFQWEALRDGALLPVVGGLLAIAIGGTRLPWSVRP
jgi:uncharacterized membrane protein YphA (DoxX/SURF4 family)